MNSPDEFDRMVAKEFPEEFEAIDPAPYGTPARPAKAGLTRRGKAAVAIGATILAGGALIGYQAYSSSAAEQEAKAQEIALQQQRIELDKLKEMNRAHNTQTGQEKTRQASINSCVKDKEDLIGKGFGSPSYRDIVDACQAQYTPTTSTDGMQAAASSQANDSDHEGISAGSLVGIAVLVGGFTLVIKLGTRRNQA